MEFHIREATGTSPVAVGLYANSSDYRWSESTVTWNYADFTLTKQYATASPGYGNETVYDITDLVHAWQAGEEDANMGITLKSSNETSVDKAFYATEYSTSSYRPYVTLTYDSEIELNKSVVNLAPNGTTTITAETAVAGGTITWSSSDTSIVTVAKTGTSTCQVTAVKSGVTTITATVNDGPTASCTVYVSITNGVYFIKSGSLYLSVDGGMIEGSTLTLQAKKSGGPAQFRQLWKITHIGQHYYSIRSLYRPDLALHANDDGTVDVATLSTSITGSDIPLNRRWKISRDGSGYLFHFAGTSSLELRPQNDTLSADNDVVVGHEPNDTFAWTLEWGPTIENQILLINTTNGLPATNAVRYVTPGETITLTNMKLKAVYVSKTTNAQSFEWTSLSPSFATVQETTGAVTGVWEGQATIKATNTNSTNAPTYTMKVSAIPEGTYYIRNREYGEHLQVEDLDYANNYSTSGAIMEIWPHNGEDYQKWTFNSLGNGYYSIINYYSGLALSVPAGQTGTSDVSLVQEVYNGYDRQKWKITQTDYYCYKLKPKSAEGASNDLVMAVGDFQAVESYDANVEQLLFSDVIKQWQESNRLRVKGATDAKYSYLIESHILPSIGGLKLSEITAPTINTFLLEKTENGRLDGNGGLSASYVRSLMIIIKSVMKFAVDEQLCMPLKSPIHKPQKNNSELMILDVSDQKKIEETALNDLTPTKAGILISLYTGLRIGEICALTWDDVDLKVKIIHVRHTIARVKNKQSNSETKTILIMDEPKTFSSKRDIPIPTFLNEVLLELKKTSISRYVISEKADFVSPRTFEYRYHKILEKCNIEPINFHTLRHPYVKPKTKKFAYFSQFSFRLRNCSLSSLSAAAKNACSFSFSSGNRHPKVLPPILQ